MADTQANTASGSASPAADGGGSASSTETPAGAAAPGAQGTDGGDKAKATQSQEPAALEITLPDGFKVDEASLAAFKKLAGEVGLSSEAATKLVAWQAEINAAAQKADTEAREAALKQVDDGWVAELRADKDLGGAKYEATRTDAQRAIARFGDKALVDDLTAMGLMNHPGLVRMMARMGRAIGEDRGTDTRRTDTPASGPADTLRAMYPSMYAEDGTLRY